MHLPMESLPFWSKLGCLTPGDPGAVGSFEMAKEMQVISERVMVFLSHWG